jgi:hypothetical protein
VEGRGGTYERGGGSGSVGLNPFQRMLRRAGSVTTPSEIIPYYRLNYSIWSLSDNKESSR